MSGSEAQPRISSLRQQCLTQLSHNLPGCLHHGGNVLGGSPRRLATRTPLVISRLGGLIFGSQRSSSIRWPRTRIAGVPFRFPVLAFEA